MKRYAQDWINCYSSKCDEDKAHFTTEYPRFAELIEGEILLFGMLLTIDKDINDHLDCFLD